MAVGKISGPLLKENLIREGIDLAFETDLIYLDVNNRRVGVKTSVPSHELTVNGTARSTNLEVTNTANISDVTITGNQIYSNTGTLDLFPVAGGSVIYQSKLIVDSLQLQGNAITNINSASPDINFTANGTGNINLNSNTLVNGNLHATGVITADGNITIGDADTDNVIFNADVASDIIPDIDNTYQIGTSTKKWKDLYVDTIIANTVSGGNINVNGIDLGLSQGNIYYVATNGDDGNSGIHQNDPLSSLGRALDLASAGDLIFIYPGTYQETMPLTVPVGVTIKGSGLRSVTIEPDSDVTVDVFLLNGETTIEDLTIKNFEFDSATNTGYAFKFAPGFKVTTRSPYIRNVTVLTFGSTVRLATNPVDDPRGFLSGDAGKGAYLDGSIADPTSNEASCLFHSVTFICPGVDAVTALNGVRIEWLNCFTYFADRGLYLLSGSAGFAGNGKTRLKVYGISAQTAVVGDTISVENVTGSNTFTTATIESITYSSPYTNIIIDGKVSGFEESLAPPDTSNQQIINFSGGETASYLEWADYSDFGVELRSIGSANVYGNYGVYGDGEGVLGYLVGQNFAYIGSGRISDNNPIIIPNDSTNVNEVVQFNRARIYYTSVDARGNFKVGDFFSVDQQTGEITFTASNVSFSAPSGIIFTDGINQTEITPTKVETGNIRISGNTIESTALGITLSAANNTVDITSNTNITGNLIVTNNVTIQGNTELGNSLADTLTINARINSDVVPSQTALYDLGSNANYWRNIYIDNALIDDISISGNVIQTTVSNADLELRANGSGIVSIPQDSLNVTQNLTVSGTSNLQNTNINGTLFATNISTNNLNVANTTTIINDIEISGNQIRTTVSNSDLEFSANGSGDVVIPENDVIVEQNFTVSGTATINTAIVSGALSVNTLYTPNSVTSNTFITDDIRISGNVITTTLSNSNLELKANGSGIVNLQDNTVIDNNLTVNGVTNLQNTIITGTFNTTDLISGSIAILGSTNIDSIEINNNYIRTTLSNTNLELRANGSGIVNVQDSLVVDNNLTVLGTTSLQNTTVTGNLNTTNLTTGSISMSGAFIIDDIEINGNVIRTTVSNTNLELRTNGTGTVELENFSFNNNVITSTAPGQDFEIVPSGTGIVKITSNQALTIPVGSQSQRPTTSQAGMIRFNSTINQYEGYNGTYWIQLGGVIDVDRDTYIIPETSPGANENTLYFVTNGQVTATLNTTAFNINKLVVDNIEIDGNIIRTTTSNTDLELRPNGTGTVVMDNFSIGNNIIKNLTAGAVTQFQSTGSGYYHIVGTNAVGLPAGGSGARPLIPVLGMVRWNTDFGIMEAYDGTTWTSVAGTGSGINVAQAQDIALAIVLSLG